MTAQLRWGFIGASTIAHEHMVAAVREAGQEVVAICSGSLARARDFAGEHRITHATSTLEDLLRRPDVDAVYISSTNDRHAAQVRAAAAAGKHVLCEKPLATTLEAARAMVDACREAGVVMATNHHLRNAATHRMLREQLAGGVIGRPLFARIQHAVHLRPQLQGWRVNDAAAGGGVILDIVVHDADLLRFVLGAEPVEAQAMEQGSAMASGGVEDGVMAVLRLSNGMLAQVHAAYSTPHAALGFEILGETGSLVARDALSQRPVGQVFLRGPQGETEIPLAHENLYARGLRQFAAAVAGQGVPAATGEDGLRSLATALAVAESARSARRVAIAPEPPARAV